MSVGVAATKRRRPIFIIVGVAVFLLVISFVLVWYQMNFRFVEYENGIKFVGKVQGEIPYSGTIYYSEDNEARLDMETKTITYQNGDVYTGDVTYLLPDGKGKMVFASGDIYEGEYDAGKMTGQGTFTYINGESYTGAFLDGLREGKGTYTYPNGSKYEGEFKNNQKHGVGVYTWANEGGGEYRYEGSYVDGKKEGKGKFSYPSGDVYEGDFKADVRTGVGTYTWANGESYTGEFLNNKMHGKGVYTWPSANSGAAPRSYEGYFENGQIVLKDDATPPATSTPAQ